MTWPDNVTELSVRAPETHILEALGLAIHGQGFAHRKCDENLVERYPRPARGLFNIGVLHTSLAGYEGHDTYAPASVSHLEGKGYDYWALGHIHQRQQIASESVIHYSGNTQGRHARETGPKGCLLATVDDGSDPGRALRLLIAATQQYWAGEEARLHAVWQAIARLQHKGR